MRVQIQVGWYALPPWLWTSGLRADLILPTYVPDHRYAYHSQIAQPSHQRSHIPSVRIVYHSKAYSMHHHHALSLYRSPEACYSYLSRVRTCHESEHATSQTMSRVRTCHESDQRHYYVYQKTFLCLLRLSRSMFSEKKKLLYL